MGILHALHYLWNVPIWVDHDEVEKKKKTINVELKTETIKRARIHPPTNHGGRSHQRHRPKIKSFWFHFIFEATPFTGKWRVIKLSRLTWFSQTILMSFAALYIMSFVIFEKLKWIDDDDDDVFGRTILATSFCNLFCTLRWRLLFGKTIILLTATGTISYLTLPMADLPTNGWH